MASSYCKFFLYVSKDEQKRRFLERWISRRRTGNFLYRMSGNGITWDEYIDAYEEPSRTRAPNGLRAGIIPADHKWGTHLSVAAIFTTRFLI